MARFAHIDALRADYAAGRNVMRAFNDRHGLRHNAPESIEAAYEIQAGQYIRNLADLPAYYDEFTDEQAAIFTEHFPGCESVVDAGCGELTTAALLFPKIETPAHCLAFDLSWSRVNVGREHFRATVDAEVAARTRLFVADICEIPLPDNSVDVVVTSHALEPNHGREAFLVTEMLRIARRGLVLFEPSWELGDDDQRAYMDEHGFVRDLAGHCTRAGGLVADERLTEVHYNPRNRTAALVVYKRDPGPANEPELVDPVTRGPLVFDEEDRVYHARERSVVYPCLRGIPVLKESAGMLATGFAPPPGDDPRA